VMTHLNTFSYPSRLWIFVIAFVLNAILEAGVFRYYWWREVMDKEKRSTPKFWTATLRNIVFIAWMLYDIVVSVNTYKYGNAIAKTFADVLLDVAFTAHSSCVFLILSFLHAVFKKAFPSANFMSQLEFKIYLIYSVVSFALYPIIQWCAYKQADYHFVVVPQLIYWAEMLISGGLFIWLIIRMRKLHQQGDSHKKTQNLIFLLTILLVLLVLDDFFIGTSLNIINLGLVAGEYKAGANWSSVPINKLQVMDPLFVDYLTAIFSMTYVPFIFLVTCILNINQVQQIYNLIVTTYGSTSKSTDKMTQSFIPPNPVADAEVPNYAQEVEVAAVAENDVETEESIEEANHGNPPTGVNVPGPNE